VFAFGLRLTFEANPEPGGGEQRVRPRTTLLEPPPSFD